MYVPKIIGYGDRRIIIVWMILVVRINIVFKAQQLDTKNWSCTSAPKMATCFVNVTIIFYTT